MKRWQKVVTGIAAAAVVLAAAGFGTYKLYIVPNILEPAAEKASAVLADKDFQETMNSMAAELQAEGLLDEEVFNKYFADAQKTSEPLSVILGTAVPEEEIATIEAVAGDMGVNISQVAKGDEPITNNNAWELKDKLASSGVSESSINKVTSAMEIVPDPPATERPADTSGSSSNSGGKSESSKNESSKSEGSKNESSKSEGSSSGGSSSSEVSGDSAYERIKNAASASEFAAGAAILGKIDVGTVMSLYNSDRAACKEYITSRLSASEISTALALYGKYSHLL